MNNSIKINLRKVLDLEDVAKKLEFGLTIIFSKTLIVWIMIKPMNKEY